MRVLLIQANREFFPMYAAPLGIAYLAAVLQKEGHDVEILDLAISDDFKKDISRTVDRFNPEVIGISIRNIDIATYPATLFFYPPAKEAVQYTKEITDVPIILGGAGFSIFAEEVLRDIPHDIGVVGEGEYAFAEIVKRIERGDDPRKVPKGVCFLNNGEFVEKEPWRVQNLDALPLPARDLLDNDKYQLADGRVLGNIQTQRGCPYNCIFCSYPLLEGHEMRYRSPEKVAEEMDLLVNNYGVECAFIVDNSFNTTPSHAKAVSQAMIDKNIDAQWGANYKPDGRSVKFLPLMRKSGCEHLAIGVESLSDDVLDRIKKGNTTRDVIETAKKCTELKIEQFMHVLLGMPGETPETVERTLNTLSKLDIWMGGWQGASEALIMTGVRIYPHTELEKIAEKDGVISNGTNLLLPKFYISPTIGEEKLLDLVRSCTKGRERWNVPGLDMNIPQDMIDFMNKQLISYGLLPGSYHRDRPKD